MAPVIRQDATELMDESLVLMGVNFDEISSLATSNDFLKFDRTKLVEDNGLDLFQHPPVVVLPVNPEPQPVAEEYTIHSDPQPASPGPEYLVLQPASPQPQLVAEKYLINLDTQPASPELQILQPAVPEPSMQQILTPAPMLQQALSPEPYDIQVQSISPQLLDLPASPEPFIIKVETFSPQQGELDLLVPPASHELTADASVLSPSSVWKEEPTSPASQQAADAPKKRGRKRKYPEGMAPSRRRSTRPKVYLMDPLPDEEMEKKRRNAVNAKKHRDMQKKEKQKLSDALAEAKAERDLLQQMVNQYKQREQQLLQMLSGRGIKVDGLHPSLEGF